MYLPHTPFPSFHPSSCLILTGGALNGGSLKLIMYISFATRHIKRGTLSPVFLHNLMAGSYTDRQQTAHTPFHGKLNSTIFICLFSYLFVFYIIFIHSHYSKKHISLLQTCCHISTQYTKK